MNDVSKIGQNNRYRWVIVVVSFLMVCVCLGFCSGTKSLYLSEVTKALGIPRSEFSLNDSFRFIATAIVNMFFGVLIQKFGARKMVAAGFASLTSSMLIYSFATSVYVFYIGGVLLGIGLSWTTTTMVGYIVDCWCKEHKGTIMGAVLAGNGVGAAIAAQILSGIIYEEGNAFAYRNGYRLTALVLLVVGIIVVALLRNKPNAEIPTGKKHKKARGESWVGIDFNTAIHKPYFWLIAACAFFTGMVLQSIAGISSAHLRDVGFHGDFVALALSIRNVALAGSKFLSGVSYDRLGLKKTLGICNIAGVVTPFLLAIVQPDSTGSAIVVVFSILAAVALPLDTVMLPLIASDVFGKASFAKLVGILVGINAAGFAVGVPITNLTYDILGSYVPALYVLSGIMLVIFIAYLFILPKAEQDKQQILAQLQEASAE